MCECLCGEIRPHFVFTPKASDATVCMTVYPGCEGCEQLLGVDVRVFNPKGVKEWLDGNKGKEVEGDEYGHLPSFVSIPVISLASLKQAAREDNTPGTEDYDSLADWLDDYGFKLLNRAAWIELKRFMESQP